MYKHFFKRGIDFFIALVALLVIWPLLLIVTVWLHFANKGAGAFFLQERPGKDAKIFKVIKFKSMTDVRDADGNLLPDEQRLTKVGKFVRSTSIDELPQLINVLKGDMALIGPRPLTVEYLPFYTEEQSRRHYVRPGITGWAQVNGRNHQKLSKKFEMDVWYVDNLSLRLDIKIIFLTIKNVLKRSDVGEGSGDMKEVDDLHILERILARRKSMKTKEIGSNFDLSPDVPLDRTDCIDLSQYQIEGDDVALLSTGRSCISYIIDDIEREHTSVRKIALIPPFTCHTVIDPFLHKGYDIFTYAVDSSLNIDIEKFREEVRICNASVVLVHRYFGFDTLLGFNEIVKEFSQQVIFIEDKTQCLYSNHAKLNTDYIVGSFRKWGPLPDGGYAVKRIGKFADKPTAYDVPLIDSKLKASYLKHEYLHNHKGVKQDFLDEYRRAEDILDGQKQYYEISPASSSIQISMNMDELKDRRRTNYKYVYDALKAITSVRIITPQLTDCDVPLYIALSCNDRIGLQKHLQDASIYAPIVWPKAEHCPTVCTAVDIIYGTVLCLPIDQRYEICDMDRMVKIIEEYETK